MFIVVRCEQMPGKTEEKPVLSVHRLVKAPTDRTP